MSVSVTVVAASGRTSRSKGVNWLQFVVRLTRKKCANKRNMHTKAIEKL